MLGDDSEDRAGVWDSDSFSEGECEDNEPLLEDRGQPRRRRSRKRACFIWEGIDWDYVAYLFASCFPARCGRWRSKVYDKQN